MIDAANFKDHAKEILELTDNITFHYNCHRNFSYTSWTEKLEVLEGILYMLNKKAITLQNKLNS